MKILVTGGLGFVGSNLVDMLAKDHDNEIYVIDNLSSESSSTLYQNYKVKYILDDINNIFEAIPELIKFDVIYHLAGEARIQPSFTRPLDYFQSNILGTAKILDYARLSKSGIVVYATTSSKNHGTAFLTPYTYSKVAGEHLLKLYSECFGMNTASATFYNVYGPREPKLGEWATVVAKFLRQYKNREQLTIVGTGKQTRDFTHVEDICKGLISISKGNWIGNNFDLGKGEPISIFDLAMLITEDESKLQYVPLRKNEGLHTLSNYIDSEKYLNWKAEHTLQEYIKQNK